MTAALHVSGSTGEDQPHRHPGGAPRSLVTWHIVVITHSVGIYCKRRDLQRSLV